MFCEGSSAKATPQSRTEPTYFRDMLKFLPSIPFLFASALTAFASTVAAQSPCVDGMAAGYPCQNVDFLSFMPLDEVGGGNNLNDIWGWTDPIDGTEYVLLGRNNGTAFIDISDPVNPVLVADLPTQSTASLWRDVKVYDNHAFIVSEAGGHGMQVVDLTQLGNITNPPVTIQPDAVYEGWGNAHNIVINESTGRAYGVGTNTFAGGLHILDISEPLNPTLIGDFADDGSTHDAQVVSYIGPDANYAGKEVAFCCNGNTVTIVDVTDPTDATLISATGYPGVSYSHQGWLTEDHRYFISNDELDEMNLGINTTSFIWDVSDLSAPQVIGTFVSTSTAIDHNLYIRDTLVYQSNYRAGLRVLNAADIENGNLAEIGYFDVEPTDDAPQFSGTWSNYPYFDSGVIAVTNINEGLFLVQVSGQMLAYGCTDPSACNYDPAAEEDNGSCLGFNECGDCEGTELYCVGCMDASACNFSEVATIDDGSCFDVAAPEAQSAVQTTEAVTFTGEGGTHWYESEFTPNPLFIGPSYTLPLLGADGSVWAAHSNGEYEQTGGKTGPDLENGQFHINNNYWMRFDVFQDVILESVEVYSEGGGPQTIEILDAAGNFLHSLTQQLGPGLNVFLLNAEIPAGDGYQIRSGNDQPLLWREDSGADVNYPYAIGSLANITGTTITGQNEFTYYYFYYNWKMSSINPCLSERTQFTVTVEDVSGLEEMTGAGERQLVKMIDVTGREIERATEQMVFLIYSDGSVEKRILGDRE